MGAAVFHMGFRLNLKWGLSLQPPSSPTSPARPSSFSFRGGEPSYDSARLAFPSFIYVQTAILYNDLLQAQTCLSCSQLLENDDLEPDEMAINWRPNNSLNHKIDDSGNTSNEDNKSALFASLQTTKLLHLRLLMKNLYTLEETFADSDVVRLEKDILVQLQRLGALRLFHTCLSRTIKSPTSSGLSDMSTELAEPHSENPINDCMDEVVRSRRKEERKSRKRRSEKEVGDAFMHGPHFTAIADESKQPKFSSGKRSSYSKNKRRKITKSEAELSRGVKLIAELERIRTLIEEETGQIAGLGSLSEAAGLEKRVLLQHLHFGWCCRDELLRSAHSLVVYLARNYRGLGVAFEDLIQAGNIGVLQGAERFDHTRGYKFSTYVQFWIRKSMATLVAQHARGIRIPELAPDSLIMSPEETVMRKNMSKDIYTLLQGLEPREREVLVLRFGLANNQRRSLEEIGRRFGVSKEWIRKIERTALTKLRNSDTVKHLSHYLQM